MKLTVFEQRLARKIDEALPGVTPGLALQVFQAGKKVADLALGTTFPYYDLASLTKVIFTTQAMIWSFQKGQWALDAKVKTYLPWFPDETVHITELLNHSSGLPWWLPVYQSMEGENWREQLKEILKTTPLERKKESVYSDVGFWVLGFLLEEFFQKPLLQIWQEMRELFYPRLAFEFHPDNQPLHPVKLYAPTERCPRRGHLQGVVHDDNAYAFGGVATHAGLFGSVDDVGWFGLFIRGQLQGISKTLIKQKTAQLFATRARPPGMGDWALGYMMPTQGKSSCGDFFSPYSIGHTGFTGTSFWYDPIQDLIVVLLSNRVAFGRDRDEFRILRPQIHNWIVEGLRRGAF